MIATLHHNREKGQRCGGDDSRMPETHKKTDHTQSLPNYPGQNILSKPDQPRRHSNQPDHSQMQRLKTPREKSGN